jgi:hypothetical protein
MKRMKLVGLAVFAIALSAMGTASAIAEEGFLPKQESANVLAGKYTVATSGGLSIACAKLMESHITWTTDEHGSGTLWLLECKFGGLFNVNSLGDKAGEILEPVLILVCLDPKDAEGKLLADFGLAIELDEPLHLEIPALGSLVALSAGRLIGVVLTKVKAKLFVVDLTGTNGAQLARSCVKGKESKEDTRKVEENESKASEAISENAEGLLLQFPNEVELMDA